MDFVLLAIVLYFSIKGFAKGFVTTTFSLATTFFVAYVSYQFADELANFLINETGWFGKIQDGISLTLNSMFPGQFVSMQNFQNSLSSSKYAVVFAVLLKLLAVDISFDGELSAGQIFAPSLTYLLAVVVCFMLLFVTMRIILKVLCIGLNRFVNLSGMSHINRIMGLVSGAVLGLIVFGIFYSIFVAIANFSFNQALIEFAKSGNFSYKIYQIFISKIISLFY